MVLTDFTGSFWSVENVKDQDIGVIIDEGKYEEKKNSKTNQSYMIFNISIESNSKKKLYSPSRETGMRFTLAWGEDSKKWVGHKVQFRLIKGYLEAFPLV